MLFDMQGQCYEVLSGPYGAAYNAVRDAGDRVKINERSDLTKLQKSKKLTKF
jgi:hypothetical protein